MPDGVRVAAAPPGEPFLGFAIVAVLALIVLAVCVVRAVPPHQRLVVADRRGRTRVRGPGLVAVWPPAARTVPVRLTPEDVVVEGIDAVTADGIGVRAAVVAQCRVADPARFAGHQGVWAALDRALEGEVRRHVAARGLAELAAAPDAVLAAPVARSQATDWGIELGPVELRDVTVAVDPRLTRWAASVAPEGQRRREDVR